jgi:hypothetical protein
MSRGPGKWERAILTELASRENFWLRTLLPRDCTKAEYNALLRAALKLEAEGKIAVDRWAFASEPGIGKTAVRRIGTSRPERVNVGAVPQEEPNQHLTRRRGGLTE